MTSYRVMDDRDLKNLYAFAAPIWRECYKGVIPDGQIDLLIHKYFDYENILKFRENGMIYEYVFFEDETAGFIAYQLFEDHTYLDKIYLAENFRGKHISSGVFDYLVRTYGKPLRLNVNQGNRLGIRAYEGNGFRVIESKNYDLPGGYVNCDYIMEKPVG